jgi:hypothetical protein
MTEPLGAIALSYLDAGLCVLPAIGAQKRPAVPEWKLYQNRQPTTSEMHKWFSLPAPSGARQAGNGQSALCLVCGQVSGNLEMLDFDAGGELFQPWCAVIREAAPGLLERLVIERTPSGGRHVAYRSQETVCGNLKLTQRRIETPNGEPVTIGGKQYAPRQDAGGQWHVLLTLIETRGEGGLFLCAPSPGYELAQGDFTHLPVLTADEREILLSSAWALNEHLPAPESVPVSSPNLSRPGDDYAARGDVRALLQKHGWTLAKSGENEYWRRPGKSAGWSATLKNGVFYVFSSNAAPFESEKAYAPFSVYAHLEHNGDFTAAARALRAEGYGGNEDQLQGVDLTKLLGPNQNAETAAASAVTPSQLVNYDSSNDPNTLLGNRWLCRAGSCLLVGQTGIGKSSFCVQAAITWALGKPLFGLAPVRPLKSLIIQAENDIGDLSEMFTGVISGTGCANSLHELDSRIVCITDTTQIGKAFFPWARALVLKYSPDLVWIDPLFSFIGGDANNQETVSAFLRAGLGTIAQEIGCAWIFIHHTTKPPKDPLLRNAVRGGDYSYLGAGSAELANWARAILVLREARADACYELRACKRGRRAGLLDSADQPTTELCLRHAAHSICWERAESEQPLADANPAEPEAPAWTVESFVAQFVGQEPKSQTRIVFDAEQAGLSSRKVSRYLKLAEEDGLIHPWTVGTQKTPAYATVEQPAEELPQDDTKQAAVRALLASEPALSTKDVAERCGVSWQYANRVRKGTR